MRHLTSFFLVSIPLVLTGCPESSPTADRGTLVATTSGSALVLTTAAPSASAAGVMATASASAPASQGPAPSCKVLHQKVWGAGANKLTGLTARHLDKGSVAVGFAYGNTPHVLLIDRTSKDNQGQVLKVEMKADSKVSKSPPAAEGTRHLMRVTPTSIEKGKARAFVDYRDEFKDKRRRVSCGPAESDEGFTVFEGTSYLDLKPAPTGDDKKKLFSSKISGLEGYAEMRDCRTFYSRQTKEIWVIGSELHGIDKGASTEWRASLFIDFGPKEHERVIHETNLRGDPPTGAPQYEIPTVIRADEKGYLVASRINGSLLIAPLDPKKKPMGKPATYPGLPLLPDLSRIDKVVSVIAPVSVAPGRFALRSLQISTESMELPRGYTDLKVDEDSSASKTEPELILDSKGQRWLAYIEGERDKGHLEIVPVDASLKPLSAPYSVTEDKERASEVRMVPMEDGDILVAYLRDSEGKVELVTEELSCEPPKK